VSDDEPSDAVSTTLRLQLNNRLTIPSNCTKRSQLYVSCITPGT
jgi:hypothetical protein